MDKGDEEHASAATSRFLVLSTLAWVVWGTSFVSALLIMYYYLSRGPHLLMVHLGATFICSLFAEVFMISAFVTFVNPDLSQEHVGELKKETEGKKQQKPRQSFRRRCVLLCNARCLKEITPGI